MTFKSTKPKMVYVVNKLWLNIENKNNYVGLCQVRLAKVKLGWFKSMGWLVGSG